MTTLNPDDFPPGSYHELPLFPLNNVVLFPAMPLPLHIFEERYKAMIGDCINRNAPFGVLLIREGREVGAPATPHSIGTTARIVQAQRLEEGRLNILARGETRFELLELVQTTPHQVGLVRYLDDVPGDISPAAVSEVQTQYIRLQRHLTAMSGGWEREVTAPDDPLDLARLAAAALAVSMPLPPDVRQSLLETPTAGARLERLQTLLEQANRIIADQAAENSPFRGPRLN